MHPAKLLMVAGLILLLIGGLWYFADYFAGSGPLSRLGRLPGDINIRRGHWNVYIPITSCILLSIILTLIFSLFRR
ncbi:MAG TPA: DUF2905 domain-containing protein [Acidobacteriota bacterium]|jgi:hypothetical protein|nr:DUF2905 domain-containing protein [Acidobacteriota bacterium]